MNGLPSIAGRLEVEQQIGAFPFQVRKEEYATRHLGILGMPSCPRVPFSGDSQACGAIVSSHALAFLLPETTWGFSVLLIGKCGRPLARHFGFSGTT
jgi:hypothetical protein